VKSALRKIDRGDRARCPHAVPHADSHSPEHSSQNASAPQAAMVEALLRWAALRGRRTPWRLAHDIYPLGVAEILLQKTKGDDVAPVWLAVMARCPTAEAMAIARDDEVREIVRHLGLGNQRVERLKSLARALSAGCSEAKIPGLGPYGSAILALAQGRHPDEAPVDGNIARVICRLYGLEFERGEPRKKPEVKQSVTELLEREPEPSGKLRVAYALVDLGALVCTPNKPSCPECPLSRWCSSSCVEVAQHPSTSAICVASA
jgi:A/G-specific adenine glycosylase